MRRFLLILIAAALFAPAADAAGPAFGVRALGKWKLGYFVYDTKPGTTLSGRVQVTNTGDRAGTVKLFAADATTGQTSGTVYLTSGERQHDVGAWIRLPATRLELGPGERRTVPFTVVVPSAGSAGEHVGGIVAETAERARGPKSKGKANVRITVRNLAIVAVQVNVAGPKVAKFTVLGVKAGGRKGYQQLLVRVRNDGNVMRKPAGTIAVDDAKGKQVLQERFQLDTFLPHTTIDYPVNVSAQALDAGKYSATVELQYAGAGDGTQKASLARTFEITPQQVAQVFTSASKPTPPPSAATGASGEPSASPAPPSGGSSEGGGGISAGLIVLIVLGGLALLGAGYLLALRTIRKA